jgi:hypothetical protein
MLWREMQALVAPGVDPPPAPEEVVAAIPEVRLRLCTFDSEKRAKRAFRFEIRNLNLKCGGNGRRPLCREWIPRRRLRGRLRMRALRWRVRVVVMMMMMTRRRRRRRMRMMIMMMMLDQDVSAGVNVTVGASSPDAAFATRRVRRARPAGKVMTGL